MADKIVVEKLEQAVGIMRELDIDLWITYARETTLTPDPCLEIIAGFEVTWHSAFLVSKTGERVAIVGRFDAENVQMTGGYSRVIPYDESIKPALLEVVRGFDPRSIALNYSENDPAADGLTHGMFLDLQRTLEGSPFASRFVSSEGLVSALRGRKSPSEVELIRAAIKTTEELYSQVGQGLGLGQQELDIAERLTSMRKSLGLGTAWAEEYCPIVNAGPDSPVGHAAPGRYETRPGHLLHMDFGVKQDGFCSDLQRMWYIPDEDEAGIPDDVRRAWDACWGAIDAGAALLKPGVRGWEVDEAARSYLIAAGYPEYQHALGHGLGRVAHDGATLLGPRWDRYGNTPYGVVEAGNVFTLELGTVVPGRGYIGLEEDVLVTEDGIEWLSTPQRELWVLS
ncbi:MAG TPA: Xaa-Pro peptidase family protein [Chloroflexia bacterium]|jgi:Xaa-Pro aminopeptidase